MGLAGPRFHAGTDGRFRGADCVHHSRGKRHRRNFKPKGGAACGVRIDCDPAAVLVRHRSHERQAQPYTARIGLPMMYGASKTLEQMNLLVQRNSGSVVTHRDNPKVPAARNARKHCGFPRRVFDRVADQIGERPAEHLAVAVDNADLWHGLSFYRHMLGLSGSPDFIDRVLQHVAQIQQVKAPGFDLLRSRQGDKTIGEGQRALRQRLDSLRGTVQRHHHTAYVFAGSKTRLLADMTNDPRRAFWKLGSRLFLGPIPRLNWHQFLTRGFTKSAFRIQKEALDHLLDAAEDVPFNIQQLANSCWELLRTSTNSTLTPARVDEALVRLVTRENSSYTQLWNSRNRQHKTVLKAVIAQHGTNLRAAEVLARYGIPASTMHTALKNLDDRGMIRQEESIGAIRYRLEDPFFAPWLRLVQAT